MTIAPGAKLGRYEIRSQDVTRLYIRGFLFFCTGVTTENNRFTKEVATKVTKVEAADLSSLLPSA
jgi:hypothetical protein